MGEDSIISSTSKNKEIIFHIRFHILPNIMLTQTNSKRNIILKTKIIKYGYLNQIKIYFWRKVYLLIKTFLKKQNKL